MTIDKLQESQLRPGDVLLVRGDSRLSEGIRELDGGSYSHAAIWDGSSLIESTLPRVRVASFEQCAATAVLIDAYRHAGGATLGGEVVERARAYVGRPYATMDLALCTLVVAVSSWMPEEWSEMNALYGMGRLQRLLRFLTVLRDTSRGERVTCVELVARAYFNAGLPLRVRLAGHRRFNGITFYRAVRDVATRLRDQRRGERSPDPLEARTSRDTDLAGGFNLDREIDWLLDFDVEAPSPAVGSRSGEAAQALRFWWNGEVGVLANAEVPLGFELSPEMIAAKELVVGEDWTPGLVTPRLLESSSDLVCVGRLHER